MAARTARVEQISIRVFVDKEKNQVVLAEAGKDFVDVLLSFLTMPLGTIARLVGKSSDMQPVRLGSLSSLYESVRSMAEKHFWTEACKEMLVQPRNSMEKYCQSMKLNIDDKEPSKFFICGDSNCRFRYAGLLSTFRNSSCKCGKILNKEIFCHCSDGIVYKGFVSMETFIISDDLKVMHQTTSILLKSVGCEILTVNVGQKEILDLLKCSLLSKTPLTDLFIRKKKLYESSQICTPFNYDVRGSAQVNVKIILRKSSRTILIALGEANFVDFILRFPTYPLGAVEHLLKGNSCLGSIDNLYKTMADLNASKSLINSDLQRKLIRPQIAPQMKLTSQILPIEEASQLCYSLSHDSTSLVVNRFAANVLTYVDRKSGMDGFARKPEMYMVTDDLVVTPSSYVDAVSFLNKLKIPTCDMEERQISIGHKEGLNILVNSYLLQALSRRMDLVNSLQALSRRIDNIRVNVLSYLYRRRDMSLQQW